MDIPNLSAPVKISSNSKLSLSLIIIIVFLGLGLGFWLSRLNPSAVTTSNNSPTVDSSTQVAVSTDNISDSQQLKTGKLYGNTSKNFTDTASGTIDKGGVNGEGTHTLNRPGGASQRAALTSSAVDLDLFVGKKVEVKGETNRSNKASWLMDVGSIKILE
ncbi:hypothetical protein KBC75_02740 [Candidatus Shapirobacteria bacterium]|nr:hypothetical protein [Candidatus Shapirobacteria bacterium]